MPDKYEIELQAVPNSDFESDSFEGSISIKKHRVAVKDEKDAINKCKEFIFRGSKAPQLGAGNFIPAKIYKNNKLLGSISYNGRIWKNNEKEVSNFKQLDEMKYKLKCGECGREVKRKGYCDRCKKQVKKIFKGAKDSRRNIKQEQGLELTKIYNLIKEEESLEANKESIDNVYKVFGNLKNFLDTWKKSKFKDMKSLEYATKSSENLKYQLDAIYNYLNGGLVINWRWKK